MSQLSWLHLSDLHTTLSRRSTEGAFVFDKLVEHVSIQVKTGGLNPDLIVLTGDIALGQQSTIGPPGSLAAQYAEFQQRFSRLVNVLPPKQHREILIVPGNHDVNADAIDQLHRDWVKATVQKGGRKIEELVELIEKKNAAWVSFMKRLHPFKEFIDSMHLSPPTLQDDRLIFRRDLDFTGTTVEIYGLNSAWACDKEPSRPGHTVAAARWQLMHLLSPPGRSDTLRIGLMHHPPSDLCDLERKEAEQFFEGNLTLLFTGHEHSNWLVIHPKHLQICSGAILGDADNVMSFGYNWGSIDLATWKGHVNLFTYDARGPGGWSPDAVGGTAPEGRRTFELQRPVDGGSERKVSKKSQRKADDKSRDSPTLAHGYLLVFNIAGFSDLQSYEQRDVVPLLWAILDRAVAAVYKDKGGFSPRISQSPMVDGALIAIEAANGMPHPKSLQRLIDRITNDWRAARSARQSRLPAFKLSLNYGQFWVHSTNRVPSIIFGSAVNEAHRLASLAAPGGRICSDEFLSQVRVTDPSNAFLLSAGRENDLPQPGRPPLKFYILDAATTGASPRVELLHAIHEKTEQQLNVLLDLFVGFLVTQGAHPDKLVACQLRISILEPVRIHGVTQLVPTGYRQELTSYDSKARQQWQMEASASPGNTVYSLDEEGQGVPGRAFNSRKILAAVADVSWGH